MAILTVDPGGTDSGDCTGGACQTIAYALTQASSGDTIQINDGTYAEDITIPVGVSLVSTSLDYTAVTIEPPSTSTTNPLVSMESALPGTSGANQTISYITFDGYSTYQRARCINVENRSDWRIHHCRFLDFRSSITNSYALRVYSTEESETNWNKLWPADPQAPGVDTNIDALWPDNPCSDWQFDNNVITDCGACNTTDESPAVLFHNVKDFRINHNTVTATTANGGAQFIEATPGIVWHGEFDHNSYYGVDYAARGYGATSNYAIEFWVSRGGTSVHDNYLENGNLSITIGKETLVYNNVIIWTPTLPTTAGGTAIECHGQNYSYILRNFIIGPSYGIVAGWDTYQDDKNRVCEHTYIFGNVMHDTYRGVRITGISDHPTNTPSVHHIYFINNLVDGIRNGSSAALYLAQSGLCTLSNVEVHNNGFTNSAGYGILASGSISSLSATYNGFYNNTLSNYYGCTPTNNITSDPLFTNYAGNDFTLQSGSPWRDAGSNQGETYDLIMSPVSTFSDPPSISYLSQAANGSAWEIGPFVYSDSVDITGPTISNKSPITGYQYSAGTTSALLSIDASDASGMAGVKWDDSDVSYESMANTMSEAAGTYTDTKSGLTNNTSYTVYGIARDSLGNDTSFTWEFSVSADITPGIVDNTEATVAGSWVTSTYNPAFYGSNYYTSDQVDSTVYVQFDFTISIEGTYTIREWHTSDGTRPTAAPHIITHDGGSTTVYVDQTVNEGQFNDLGSYYFTPGTYSVKITAEASGKVCADAIQFELVNPGGGGSTSGRSGTSVGGRTSGFIQGR